MASSHGSSAHPKHAGPTPGAKSGTVCAMTWFVKCRNLVVAWQLDGGDGNARKRYKQLAESVNLVSNNLLAVLKPKRYDAVVFHSGVPQAMVAKLANAYPFLQLVPIQHRCYGGWLNTSARGGTTFGYCANRYWHDAYLHMNTFRLFAIHKHPVLNSYKYMMLLDTDTYIRKPFPFDPFQKMQDDNLVFAFHECTFEVALDCLAGLGRATWDYLLAKGYNATALPGHFRDIDIRTAYAGNFNVRDLTFFRSQGYNDFMQHIDRYGGIYRHRWADQNVWVLALAMLVERERVQFWRALFSSQVVVHKSKSLGGRMRVSRFRKIDWKSEQRNANSKKCFNSQTCICKDSSSSERLQLQQVWMRALSRGLLRTCLDWHGPDL